MRGRVHYRGRVDGAIIASKWPRRRGKKKTPRQQAWVDDFTAWAKIPNMADGCTRDLAQRLACDTGFFWRDVITYAGHGKLLYVQGNGEMTTPLPMLWTERSPNQQYGAPRVTTPTASIHNGSTQVITSTVGVRPAANIVDWDNNVFVTPKPPLAALMTVRASGLYMLGAYASYNQAANATHVLYLNRNADTIGRATADITTNATNWLQAQATMWFDAGDTFELFTTSSVQPYTFQLLAMWMVAITPESII